MKNLSVFVDAVQGNVFAVSDYKNYYILQPNVSVMVLVPAEALYVSFTGTSNFFVVFKENVTATVPQTSIVDGSAPELNPTIRQIDGLKAFTIVAPSLCNLLVSFYK